MPRSILAFGLVFLLAAELGGQYRGRRGGPTPDAAPHPDAYKGAVVTFRGALKKLSKKEILLLDDENGQLLTFRRNKTTKFFEDGKEVKPGVLALESTVSIDATEDVDLKLLASAVRVATANRKPLGNR